MIRPFNKYVITQQYKGKAHGGTDYAPTSSNLDILAFESGTVAEVGYDSISGNYIVIKGNKYFCFTGHLKSKPSLKKGAKVKEGQKIGTFGKTGKATGIHTHNEIWTKLWERYRYDPEKIYKQYVKEDDMYKGKSAEFWYKDKEKWRNKFLKLEEEYKKVRGWWQDRKKESIAKDKIINAVKKAVK